MIFMFNSKPFQIQLNFPAAYTLSLPVTVTISASGTPVADQSFTLTCQATTALSNPTYQWFDDNGTLIGSADVLTINELQESNTGEYSCQVTAGSGANQRYGCGVERIVVQRNTDHQYLHALVTCNR